jgi:aminoglycoside phosphotransferase (APT) family kinase protein
MKSITKNQLSENQIRMLVRVNFGESCLTGAITELKGGMFNSVYSIERINEHDRIILKVGVVPGTTLLTYEQDIMPVEVECFRLIAEKTTVPIPKILAYDFSRKYISSNYFFMTALKGTALNKLIMKIDKHNLEKIRIEQAGYIAQIHQITGGYFGYFAEDKAQQYTTWKEAFLHMFDMVLKDSREHHVALPYERIEDVLKKNADILCSLKDPSLVDFDCHEGNIFVIKAGAEYTIEGIIDFERAFWGDPVADFPTSFIMSDDIRKEKSFLAAYLQHSLQKKEYTRQDVKLYQLYRMYIFTIMAAETFRYDFLYGHIQQFLSKKAVLSCLARLERL